MGRKTRALNQQAIAVSKPSRSYGVIASLTAGVAALALGSYALIKRAEPQYGPAQLIMSENLRHNASAAFNSITYDFPFSKVTDKRPTLADFTAAAKDLDYIVETNITDSSVSPKIVFAGNVHDKQNMSASIAWINHFARKGDIAFMEGLDNYVEKADFGSFAKNPASGAMLRSFFGMLANTRSLTVEYATQIKDGIVVYGNDTAEPTAVFPHARTNMYARQILMQEKDHGLMTTLRDPIFAESLVRFAKETKDSTAIAYQWIGVAHVARSYVEKINASPIGQNNRCCDYQNPLLILKTLEESNIPYVSLIPSNIEQRVKDLQAGVTQGGTQYHENVMRDAQQQRRRVMTPKQLIDMLDTQRAK